MKSFFCLCSLYSHLLNVLTFFPLTGGCSEGLDASRFFFKQMYHYNNIIRCTVGKERRTKKISMVIPEKAMYQLVTGTTLRTAGPISVGYRRLPL